MPSSQWYRSKLIRNGAVREEITSSYVLGAHSMKIKHFFTVFVVALVASILHSVTFLSSPVSCLVIKHLGPRRTALIASFILPSSFIISSMASSLEVLYVSLGLAYGFGACLVTNLVYIVVFCYFDKKASMACGRYIQISHFHANRLQIEFFSDDVMKI